MSGERLAKVGELDTDKSGESAEKRAKAEK
jgi:hypothetical protein